MVMRNKEMTIIRESVRRFELEAEEYIKSGRAKVHCIGHSIEGVDEDILIVLVADMIIRYSAELN